VCSLFAHNHHRKYIPGHYVNSISVFCQMDYREETAKEIDKRVMLQNLAEMGMDWLELGVGDGLEVVADAAGLADTGTVTFIGGV